MTVAKRRCTFCRGYFPADQFSGSGLGGTCSSECRDGLRDKARVKRDRRVAAKERRRHTPPTPTHIRRRIKRRDAGRCRWCSSARNLEVHHITYRSSGGPDEDWNLITLCLECHQRVHADKRLYQPILRAVIWMHYVQGRIVSVPTARRLIEREAA